MPRDSWPTQSTLNVDFSLFGYFVLLVVCLFILNAVFCSVGCVCVCGEDLRYWGRRNHVQNILYGNTAFQLKSRVALRVSDYQASFSSLVQPLGSLPSSRNNITLSTLGTTLVELTESPNNNSNSKTNKKHRHKTRRSLHS